MLPREDQVCQGIKCKTLLAILRIGYCHFYSGQQTQSDVISSLDGSGPSDQRTKKWAKGSKSFGLLHSEFVIMNRLCFGES